MSAVTDAILNRSSEPRLTAPAPEDAVVVKAFDCASRAPDHALLRPWRYLVVKGEGLQALGELFATTADPASASYEQERDKLLRMPLRAPMIIVGITSVREHPKVPAVEQVMSTAVGMGYMLLAFQTEGFGAMWRTGSLAHDRRICEGLGLAANESIAGFLYVGTVVSAKPSVPRPEQQTFVSRWPD